MQQLHAKLAFLNAKILKNEDGFVLVMSILILGILIILGLSGSNNSLTETSISRNDRLQKMAFYNSEAGVYVTPKVISQLVNNGAEIAPGDASLGVVSYVSADANQADDATVVFRKVMGYQTVDTVTNDLTFPMTTNLLNYSVNIDITRVGSSLAAGGGVEFASGYEGIGTGSSGGVTVSYKESSTATDTGPRSSSSTIEAGYKKVVGMPGGL